MSVDNYDDQIEALIVVVQQRCQAEMSDEVQQVVAELLRLLNWVRKDRQYQLISTLKLAFEVLLVEKPQLTLVKQITNNVHQELKSGTQFSPPVRVVIGLCGWLFIAIPFMLLVIPELMGQELILGIPTHLFLMVILFGSIGSVVSIMVRIQDFLVLEVRDKFILYFTGAFKPIIGMVFAIFVFAIIKSNLLPLAIRIDSEHYLFMATSFLAGFSERFAKDIVDSLEDRFEEATKGSQNNKFP
ncbi:MAG: hypothetical protein RL637_828 [Pseudomonadota bacterium]|jgi:hypothetical protein